MLVQAIDDANAEEEMARIQWSLNAPRHDWPATNLLLQGKPCLRAADIARRDWVVLDIDRKKPSGRRGLEPQILELCHTLRVEFDIPWPLVVSTGRGLNLYWRAGWDTEGEPDFHALCKGLDAAFGDDDISIDDASSPERGFKVPGTWAKKYAPPLPVFFYDIEHAVDKDTSPAVPQEKWRDLIDSLRGLGWLPEESRAPKSDGKGAPVAEGFDIYDFCDAYGIEILAEHGDRFA